MTNKSEMEKILFWYNKASCFVLATRKDLYPKLYEEMSFSDGDMVEVTLETRGKGKDRKSNMTWAVCHNRFCLDKTNYTFTLESLPSNRTEEYISKCRFETKEEAYDAFLKWKEIEVAINNAKYELGFWNGKYKSCNERPESEKCALMCIRHLDEWRECILEGTDYFSFGISEKKIYPEKEFNSNFKNVSDLNHKKIVQDIYNKIILPINH